MSKANVRKNKNKKKICIWSDSVVSPSGYGKIAKTLLKMLNKLGYECHNMATNHYGIEYVDEDGTHILPIRWERGGPNPDDKTAMHMVVDYFIREDFDYFITMGDPHFLVNQGLHKIVNNSNKMKFICYMFLDSIGVSSTGTKYIVMTDKILVPSKFASEQLSEAGFSDDGIISCPIDTDLYKPADKSKKTATRKLLGFAGDDGDLTDNRRLYFYYGRNTPRKRPEYMLEGFTKYMKLCEIKDLIASSEEILTSTIEEWEKMFEMSWEDIQKMTNRPLNKDSQLFLHIPQFNTQPLMLQEFVEKLGVKYGIDILGSKKIIFNEKLRNVHTGEVTNTTGTDEQFVEYIQMADVMISSTAAEGFGYLTVEGLACEIPVIIPDNSTAREVGGDFVTYAKCPNEVIVGSCVKQQHTSADEMLKAIIDVEINYDEKKKMAVEGREFVEENFRRGKFITKWLEHLK